MFPSQMFSCHGNFHSALMLNQNGLTGNNLTGNNATKYVAFQMTFNTKVLVINIPVTLFEMIVVNYLQLLESK